MSEHTYLCKRCASSISAVEFMDGGYHKQLADCVAYQTEKIATLEKMLAKAVKTISTVESDVEMLNSVVGRMLDR